ncbi:hypothetical protein HDU76_011342, partial [Blyttiomyces sp. JEL0837]
MAEHTRAEHFAAADAEFPAKNIEALGLSEHVHANPDAKIEKDVIEAEIETGLENGADNEVVDDFGFGLVDKIVPLDDDPTLPLFTFRYFVIAAALSAFGGVLGQIYYFKPQTLSVSALFLQVMAY